MAKTRLRRYVATTLMTAALLPSIAWPSKYCLASATLTANCRVLAATSSSMASVNGLSGMHFP